jgi:hypothetical protein
MKRKKMNEFFLVVWSGGYEAPSYVLKDSELEAWGQAEEWTQDMQDGDTVDVLRVDTVNKTVTRLG